jgi:hypothetical protein
MEKKSGKAASPDMLAQSGKIGAGELSETELDGVSGGTAMTEQQEIAAAIAQRIAEAQASQQSKIADAARGVSPFVAKQ